MYVRQLSISTGQRSRRPGSPWRAWLAGAAAVAAFGLPLAAQAQSLSGTLNARLMLTSGCVIYGSAGTTTGANFGTLDFGSRAATFTGSVIAIAMGSEGGAGTTQVVCSPEIAGIAISVDAGLHAGMGAANGVGTRAMSNGAAFIPYDVFQDPGHTIPFVSGAASGSLSVPITGLPFALPIYGMATKTNPIALPSGLYSDQLQITLTF